MDVIRKAIIEIGLKQVTDRLAAPDTSDLNGAIASAQEAVDRLAVSYEAVSGAAERDLSMANDILQEHSAGARAAQEAVGGLGQAQAAAGKAADAAGTTATSALSEATGAAQGAQNAVNLLTDAHKDVGAAAGTAGAASTDALNDQQRAAEEAGRAVEKLKEEQTRIVDANLRAADSFRQVGEGAFSFARGVALITASSEEDLQETLQVIAAFQGGFDVFRGGIDIIRGTIEAQRALTAATAAGAAAETARAGAVAATGAAATAATPAAAALNVALGPVGIAVLGITAAVATGFALWRRWGDEAEDAADRAADAIEEQRRRLQKANGETNRAIDLEQKLSSLRDQRSGAGAEDSLSERIGDLQKSRLSGGLSARRAAELAGLANQDQLERGSDDANEFFDRRLGDAAVASRQFRAAQDRLEQELSLRQRRAGLRKQQDRDRAQAIERGIRNAQATIAREQDTQRRVAEERGRLTPQQRAELNSLIARATDGDGAEDLSEGELRRLQALAPTRGGDLVQRENIREGGGVSDPTTTVEGSASRLSDAQQKLAELQAQQTRNEQDAERRIELENRNRDRIIDLLEALAVRITSVEQNIENANNPPE